jgi:ParB/RepB/Spo0J family partition protein
VESIHHDTGRSDARARGALAKSVELAFRNIAVDLSEPRSDQPRRSADPERLLELTASIRECGVLQPIRVLERGERFQIIAGERLVGGR